MGYFITNKAATQPDLSAGQAGGTTTRYVYGIGLLYEVDDSDAATYYHYDQSGSTIALTNSTGAVTDRVEYSPFGTITHRTGTTDTPYLYVGQLGIQTDSNGLLHMRARYYNPLIRRFINADPIGFAGGLNWYMYAANSPLLHVDPAGLNVYGIDGTWTDADATPGLFTNVDDFVYRAKQAGEHFRYYSGVGTRSSGRRRLWQGATGAGSDNIAQLVYNQIRNDLGSGTGNGVVNLVGWSRGAVIATDVAQRLGNDGIEVNFLGLYDAVEMNPHRNYPTSVPSNVRHFAHARSTQPQRLYPSRSYGHLNERGFPYSHSDIGTNPFGGHHNWMINQAASAGVSIRK